MSVSIKLISEQDKSVLLNLFQLYMHDLSKFVDFELNQHGRFEFKWLDYYWTDDNYIPFFIKEDDKIAGFALVNNYFLVLDKKPGNYNMCEFFILNSFKRKGVGQKAAKLVFDKFRGNWEVKPIPNSLEAEKFWINTIDDYNSGEFNRIYPKKNRLVLTFNNTKK